MKGGNSMNDLKKTVAYGFIFTSHFISLLLLLAMKGSASLIVSAIDYNMATADNKIESTIKIYLLVVSVLSFFRMIGCAFFSNNNSTK